MTSRQPISITMDQFQTARFDDDCRICFKGFDVNRVAVYCAFGCGQMMHSSCYHTCNSSNMKVRCCRCQGEEPWVEFLAPLSMLGCGDIDVEDSMLLKEIRGLEVSIMGDNLNISSVSSEPSGIGTALLLRSESIIHAVYYDNINEWLQAVCADGKVVLVIGIVDDKIDLNSLFREVVPVHLHAQVESRDLFVAFKQDDPYIC